MVADRSDTPPDIYTNPSERQCPDGFFLYALSNMPVIKRLFNNQPLITPAVPQVV